MNRRLSALALSLCIGQAALPVGSMPGSPPVNSFVLHQMGNNNMVDVTQN